MFKQLFTFFFVFSFFLLKAQNTNNVGIGILNPDPSSLLELSSTNKGLLIPRLTTSQIHAITTPANGLLVYNLDSGCYSYYRQNIGQWRLLCNTDSLIVSNARIDTIHAITINSDTIYSNIIHADTVYANVGRIDTIYSTIIKTNIIYANVGRIDTVYSKATHTDSLFLGNKEIRDVIRDSLNMIRNLIDAAMPCGSIIMWGGSISQIPTGWYLCDGTNNTPDLTDKFIRGSSSTADHLTSGGNDQITLNTNQLPAHNHTGTTDISGNHNHSVDPPNASTTTNGNHNHSVDPPNTSTTTNGNHSHSYSIDLYNNTGSGPDTYVHHSDPNGGYYGTWYGNVSSTGDHAHSVDVPAFNSNATGDHTHSIDIPAFNSTSTGDHAHSVDIPAFNSNATGDHRHAFTTDSTGGGQAITILPSYYKLAYIKKCN